MLFNSYVFCLLLLPLSLISWYFLKKFNNRAAQVSLILFSFLFYGYNSIFNLCLLILSILLNYYLCKILVRFQSIKKLIFVICMFLNLGVLFVFKYSNFFFDNISFLTNDSIKIEILSHIILPLGISFYTFQQISYVIDVYKGSQINYSIFEYTLFISFFAQLVAGPIALHDELIPQTNRMEKNPDWVWIADGLYSFSIGMGKKVLIADTLSGIVDYGFSSISNISCAEAWIVMLSYTLQIYYDFSGYCDMAYGIGKMFHIELPMNFNSPYRAHSFTEFWSRWHITLNRFFKKYVYIPLGGNKKGRLIQYRNILFVFLLSGIWHGANWTFILWGILHGVFNVLSRTFSNIRDKIPKQLTWLGTFLSINLLWILFRSNSVNEAFLMYKKLFDFSNFSINESIYGITYIPGTRGIAAFIFLKMNISLDPYTVVSHITLFSFLILAIFASVSFRNIYETQNKRSSFKLFFSVIFLILSILSFSGVSEFLYFNF